MTEYNLREAAEFLGIKPISLMRSIYARKIGTTKAGKGYVFSEDDLEKYRQKYRQRKGSGPRVLTLEKWARNFDRRRGEGSYQKLLGMFENSCTIYEDIAHEFSVTKQRVERWHNRLYTDARPHERRKTCTLNTRRQELFSNETFRTFYRAARRYFSREEIEPIQGPGGFRTNAVKIKDKKILIRKATKRTYQYGHGRAYDLHRSVEDSDHVFYRLRDPDFLFISPDVLPLEGTIFIESETSEYYKFKNNFDALQSGPEDQDLNGHKTTS